MRNLWGLMAGIFLLAVLLTGIQGAKAEAAAPEIYNLHLIQGQAILPNAAVYADIVGANETPAKNLGPQDFKVRLGPAPGTVKRLVPFEDSGEGIGYVLLVDISKSLSQTQFVQMKDTLAAFVDSMSEKDQAALITFGSEVKTLQDFTPDRNKLKEKLTALTPTDEDTAFYGALDRGISLARSGAREVPRRRVMITLTDGVNDFAGGVSKDELVKMLEHDPVPLYLIGFFQGQPTGEEESAIGVMKQFSKISGGRYYDGREGSWRGIYFAISRAIRSSFLIEMEFTNFVSEGRVYPLEIILTAANRTWTENLPLAVPAGGSIAESASPKQPERTDSPIQTIFSGNAAVYSGAAAVVLLAAGLWFWRRRRQPGQPQPRGTAGPNDAAVKIQAKESGEAAGPATAGVLVRLTRIQAGISTETFELELDRAVIIGNDPAVSNLVLGGGSRLAPAHCEIFFTAGRLYIRDLGTEAGTLVNGAAVTDRQVLEERDVIGLGDVELQIAFPAAGQYD